MIARIWGGATRAVDGDRYLEYLLETGVRDYLATPGCRRVLVLRRNDGERTEFQLLTLWDSEHAIAGFAGEDLEAAVFYPEDEAFLISRDERVRHFEVALVQDGPDRGARGADGDASGGRGDSPIGGPRS